MGVFGDAWSWGKGAAGDIWDTISGAPEGDDVSAADYRGDWRQAQKAWDRTTPQADRTQALAGDVTRDIGPNARSVVESRTAVARGGQGVRDAAQATRAPAGRVDAIRGGESLGMALEAARGRSNEDAAMYREGFGLRKAAFDMRMAPALAQQSFEMADAGAGRQAQLDAYSRDVGAMTGQLQAAAGVAQGLGQAAQYGSDVQAANQSEANAQAKADNARFNRDLGY